MVAGVKDLQGKLNLKGSGGKIKDLGGEEKFCKRVNIEGVFKKKDINK